MGGLYLFPALMGLVVVAMAFVAFYSTRLQRKAVGTQDQSMVKFDESLALARESVLLQKQAAERREVEIKLLSEIVDLLKASDSGKGGL